MKYLAVKDKWPVKTAKVHMKDHFYYEAPEYQKPVVYPFTELKEHNFTKYGQDRLWDFRETVEPTQAIPGKVFVGFKKCCFDKCKFDSKTEKDFSIILEDDSDNVIKWLRPAQGQFRIYWHHNSRQYNPDFVVETNDTIYIVETKKSGDVDDTEVQEKAKAALEYCKHATEFTMENGGKPWKYVLIPHDQVKPNMDLDFLVRQFTLEGIQNEN